MSVRWAPDSMRRLDKTVDRARDQAQAGVIRVRWLWAGGRLLDLGHVVGGC